jgi:hypothetical protein
LAYSNSTANQTILALQGGNAINFNAAGTQLWTIYTAVVSFGTATLNAWHAVVGVNNGASSGINVDGTDTAGSGTRSASGTSMGWATPLSRPINLGRVS